VWVKDGISRRGRVGHFLALNEHNARLENKQTKKGCEVLAS
jgi:hypothetical protein